MSADLRVLVVDDQESMRVYMNRVLGSIGYRCEVAENGEQCLSLCETRTFDVIFLDLVMPVMDGSRCLAELRTRHPDIHVVIISVEDDEEVVSELLHSGAIAYLCKPFDAVILQELMQQLAEKRSTTS